MHRALPFLAAILSCAPLLARVAPAPPPTATWDATSLTLDNGTVRRTLRFSPTGEISSASFLFSKTNFISPGSLEFSLLVDDKPCTGLTGWKVAGIEKTRDATGGSGATIRLQPLCAAPAFEIHLTYLLYPGLPAVRKQLTILNTGGKPLKIEAIDTESLTLARTTPTNSCTYRQYARYKHLGPYIGDCNDPLVIVHNQDARRGIAIGNETAGVIKRTACFLDGKSISAGFTHPGQEFPFRKWLGAGQQFTTPFIFTVLYNDSDDPSWTLNVTIPDLVRRHLGIRVHALKEKPALVYNTWYPFQRDINAPLVNSLLAPAAQCGAGEFVIDAGWQTNRGDWDIDQKKFPGGLRPIFDAAKSTGMKPGLWLSLAMVETKSAIFQQHPEWFVRDQQDRITNLHNTRTDNNTACMGTAWKDHIKEKILRAIRDHALAYIKLDLAVVSSAYQFDPARTGCHATGHPFHKDREESYYVLYQRTLELFDELRAAAPGLFIDCTFETAGKLQLMDYGIAQHAEGNWLSNIEDSTPLGPLRARDLAWGRSPALPASSLVIGNLPLDHPQRLLCLQSLAGALPIMLGDPRRLTPAERAEMKTWVDWLRDVERRHAYSDFRQDLPGYGEPAEGAWDGFARINTETKTGGLVGIFRQGSAEKTRLITIPYLDAATLYAIKQAPDGKLLARMTGAALKQKGFEATLPEPHQGLLFEITRE